MTAPRTKWLARIWSRVKLYGLGGRLWPAIKWQLMIRFTRMRLSDDDQARLTGLPAVAAEIQQAHDIYEGRVVAGDALLIRSAEFSELRDKDWHLRWDEKLHGSLQVDVVAGSHALMLQPPAVDDLAATITAYLSERG